MNVAIRTLIGSLAIVAALVCSAVADGLPDILGIQLGMPASEAHAKLQAQLPEYKVQVQSTNLPPIEKPVITSFSATTAVQSPDTPELYSQMWVVAVSLPFALRASEATSKWKKDIAEGQHKQDIEKAKQHEKPKL